MLVQKKVKSQYSSLLSFISPQVCGHAHGFNAQLYKADELHSLFLPSLFCFHAEN